jgi:hypothetical protein
MDDALTVQIQALPSPYGIMLTCMAVMPTRMALCPLNLVFIGN